MIQAADGVTRRATAAGRTDELEELDAPEEAVDPEELGEPDELDDEEELGDPDELDKLAEPEELPPSAAGGSLPPQPSSVDAGKSSKQEAGT